MVEVQKKTINGEAVTLPPTARVIAREADQTVGVRMMITPEIAAEWLETRGNNRKVMDSTVQTYAKDMKEGRWVFNGAPIQFDEDGKLLNGQHRLWAVIESGVTVESVVQWGIPRETQPTIDAGARWQTKDILYMQGEKNTSCLQAALRWIMREETGNMLNSRGMSNSHAQDVLDRHPNIRHSVDFVSGLSAMPLPSSPAAFLHYKISPADPEKAEEFFRRLADGVNLTETSPVYRLRERLIQYIGHGRMHRVDALAIAIIAWNAFRAGREMKALVWRKSGPAAQPFPQIEGAALVHTRVQKPRGKPPRTPKVVDPNAVPKRRGRPSGTGKGQGKRIEVGAGGLSVAQHGRR